MSIDQQHVPFELVDSTEPHLPWWMPPTEPDADWHIHRSGEFPILADPALEDPEETP